MLVIVSILIVSYGHVTKASPVCTEEKLNECYDLLNKDGLPSATVLYFSEEVMTEHCRRYRIFSECLKTISPYCTDSMVNVSIRVYQGIDDSFNFACGDGFKDYVKLLGQCFKYDEIQTEAKSCSDTFTSRTNNLNLVNSTNKKDIRVRYCMYVDDYIDCVYNMLRSFCGDEAANWQKTFDTKSIQPSMVAFQCNGWPATTTSPATNGSTGSIWVISLGVAIVLTGIMVALGLTVLICSKCRCRKRFSRRSTTTTSFDMPPPYSGPPFTICRSDSRSSASIATTTTDSSLRHGDTGVAKGTVVKTTDADVSPAAAAEISRARDGGGVGATTTTTTSRGVDAHRSVSVFEDGSADETTGAVGGGGGVGGSPFARAFTPPHGHFELPSPGSSILSYLPSSSDDDTSSLISHTCDYY